MSRTLIPYAGKEARPEREIGFYERSQNPRVAITFMQDRFDLIIAYATKREVSFAQAVRELVNASLDSLKQNS